MSHEVVERIEQMAPLLREQADAAEELGRLPDETVKSLKLSGIVRMLQPREWDGFEAHPCDFLKAVMAAGVCGASGWVAGVVGVHPWELALMDSKLQEEVWGRDTDTWIASPYAPMGRAKHVEGGYVLNGRWSFSSGTDHCEWVFLGGLVVDEEGNTSPMPGMHFVLPRKDYDIIDDSWNVVGLRGSGSKDVVVRDAFVPEYRTIDGGKVIDGRAAVESGRDEPLYLMPWSAIFPSAITAAVIGIAEAMLAAHIDYQRNRVTAFGTAVTADPYILPAIGEAASEIHASRCQLLSNVSEMFDLVQQGRVVPLELRAQGRRDQVRCSWRAVEAIDQIFGWSGGNALRTDRPMQRLWRDAHAGLNHVVNLPGLVYQTYALSAMGRTPPDAFI